MKEYFGENAKNYRQPSDKQIRLFPALLRQFKSLPKGTKVLDLGCGDGILYPMLRDHGFDYWGIDLSPDMITQAQKKYPDGQFLVSDASEFTKATDNHKFDLIIANMLFPSIGSKTLFKSIFVEVNKALTDKGKFIASIMSPYFDGYMQSQLFSRKDIDTDFRGYYQSPEKYVVHREIDGVKFDFEDYHWQLTDYLDAAKFSGLYLETVDECEPVSIAEITQKEMEKMRQHPNYTVYVFARVKNG